jgi:enoyl-CoA hydratase / 3-hydroxyacyl-CoA dehydrogenase
VDLSDGSNSDSGLENIFETVHDRHLEIGERMSNDTPIERSGAFKKVAVIGAGNMGSGIAQKIAQEGIDVFMLDVKPEFVERGRAGIVELLQQGVERGIFKPAQVEKTLARIHGTTDFQAVADADIVIEAVFEDKRIKQDLFQKLDGICGPNTIFATNTSSFYVRDFVHKISRPDKMIGLHYFYHPAKNRLLEVIPHAGTSRETIDAALLFAKLHGKTAILVKDAPGFAVNRFFVPFLNEATRMLEEGLADIPTIEEAARRAFEIGMGAFELMNVTGIPIAVHAATTLGNELGPFYAPSDILKAQMEKKTDWNLNGDVDPSMLDACMHRFYGVCLGVAAALVDEGVATMEDTDRGAKIGLRWTRGPFEIMNRIGIEKTCDAVSTVVEKYPDFRMPGILQKQRGIGRPFAFSFVDLEINGNIAFITLNRPEAMNALNETVVAQLDDRFTRAEKDPSVKAIVFQGAGKAFVAGADIRYFLDNIENRNLPATAAFTRRAHELLLRIENSPTLTIAFLDGLSLGGGSELALACQTIIATPAGSMGFPETGIGIFPGLGGMLRMARHVGPALAKYFVYTGAPISAQDAHDLGIVHRIITPAERDAAIRKLLDFPPSPKYAPRDIPQRFQQLAAAFSTQNYDRLLSGQTPQGLPDELAARLLKIIGYKAPLAIRIADEIIERQAHLSIPEAVEAELARLEEIFSTADAREGLTSAMQRRRPTFQGR